MGFRKTSEGDFLSAVRDGNIKMLKSFDINDVSSPDGQYDEMIDLIHEAITYNHLDRLDY